MFSYFFVSVQKTAQIAFRIFLQIRNKVDGAKFKSHDSDGHFQKSTFKNGRAKKNSNIFVSCNQVEVASKIKHAAITYNFLWYKNLNFSKIIGG